MKRCKSSAHSCVKDPLRKCNKVATYMYFALLVDLGGAIEFAIVCPSVICCLPSHVLISKNSIILSRRGTLELRVQWLYIVLETS